MTVATVDLPGRAEPLVIDDDPWREHRAALPLTRSAPTRLAYAAAHVIMLDSYETVDHTQTSRGLPDEIGEHIDWDATISFRRHLLENGFGIGEAMDTAQRVELGWTNARRLIQETGKLAPAGGFIAGAWCDQVHARSTSDLIDAVIDQARVIHAAGGIPIILPMPWLSAVACDPEMYVEVYGDIIRAVDGPVFVHWLGPMFAPALEGYFPGDSFQRVMALDPEKVRGAKLSLLDADLEQRHRAELLERDQIMLTGDDFNFRSLIAGTDPGVRRRTTLAGINVPLGQFSHALLGIFDGIAEPAGLALRLLDAGESDRYDEIMSACETLSRIVFEEPTSSYKAGLAFLAWLNGHQGNRMLVNRLETSRSPEHLLRVAEAAAEAGALTDAAMAAERLRSAFTPAR